MIPDTICDSWISESASTASEPRNDKAVMPTGVKNAPATTSNLNMRTSSYLYRIPSLSRQWGNYYQDLVAVNAKRTRRVQDAEESINDFLLRFPIDGSS